MHKYISKIKEYFPENKAKWKLYFKTIIPVILCSIIFSLNAFVDNFMSFQISGGNQALSYANSWTEIFIGIVSATSIIGTSFFAQYFGKKDFSTLKEIINFRMLFVVFVFIFFGIISFADPFFMIKLISGFDNNIPTNIFNNASKYLRLIAVAWFFDAAWFVYSMVLRESRYSFGPFIASIISLISNIVFNSIFLFGLNLDLEFLAVSTIISNIIAFIFIILYSFKKERRLLINPIKIFKISKNIWITFFKKWHAFLLLTISSLTINVRFILWNIFYPTGTIGDSNYFISAATVLGISGMFFNIFWTTIESVNVNISVFVGTNLGNKDFEIAKKNAKELQGFHLIIGLILFACLFSFSFAIDYMDFLTTGYKTELKELLNSQQQINDMNYYLNNGSKYLLQTIKYTLWPLAFFIPFFIWFITKNRILSAGGKTNIVSITEAIFGTIQLLWIVIIGMLFNINKNLDFPIAYFIFFISDLVKLVIYEIMFKKINWVNNITENNQTI